SRLELAPGLTAPRSLFALPDDGGVRPSQQFRQNHAGLRIAVVIGLQAGEDEVELLILDGSSECLGGVDGVERNEAGIFQMNGAVGSLGQRLAQYLLGARRSGSNRYYFAAVFFFLPQGFLKRIGIRFVDLVGDVLA